MQGSHALALLIIVLSRVFVFAAGMLAAANPACENLPLVAWDSSYYKQVATQGYPASEATQLNAFMPGYPLVIRTIDRFVPWRVEWTMLLVSNFAAIAGFYIFYMTATHLASAKVALLALLIAVCYPPSMFASAAYTEGPMLLATAAVLYLLTAQKFLGASVVSGLATALRPTAILLAVLVVYSLARKFWKRSETEMPEEAPQHTFIKWALLSLLSVSGVVGYQLFLWNRYDNFGAYFQAQRHWEADDTVDVQESDESIRKSRETLRESFQPPWNKLVSIGAWHKFWIVAILAVGIAGLFLPGPVPREWFLIPIGIFLLGILPGMGARWFSIARFETAALPVFLLAAHWSSKWPKCVVASCAVMFVAQLFCAYDFTRHVWVG